MRIKKGYTVAKKSKCMLVFQIITVLVFHSFFLFPSLCKGQDEPQFDEITLNLKVPGVGVSDISALVKNEKAYLSIADVFTLLKIKNTLSAHLDSISGFFINPQDEYLIDMVRNQVIFQGKKIELKSDDLLKTETNLYMKSSLFGDLFGLNCQFNILNLSVELTTKLELPTVRDMKMNQMRENLKRLRGEVKTDTTIGRSYPFFNFGMVDWQINSSQTIGSAPMTNLNFALGAVLAGGEVKIGIDAVPENKFDLKQQTYSWRYVNNQLQALRQILIGKVYSQPISAISGQLIGIQLTNTPTIYRKSFGTYILSNTTEPGWLVELYINNVLVDFQKADASGFYKFEVPLSYGNTSVKIRMIGPLGEIQEKDENTIIPFNFLPPGELEYTTTAGVIEAHPNTKYTKTNLNYGLGRKISIGGGYEYYSTPILENSFPFLNSSISMFKNILFSGEYVLNTRYSGNLSYQLHSNIQFNMNYTGYEKGQKLYPKMPDQTQRISVSIPMRIKKLQTYTAISLDQRIDSTHNKFTGANLTFSGNYKGISSSLITNLFYKGVKDSATNSNLYLSFTLPRRCILRPSLSYNYHTHTLTSMTLQLEKPIIKRGYLNISYVRDFVNNFNRINIGFHYDFSFMQSEVQSEIDKNSKSFSQSANGSLIFDRKSHYLKASDYSMVGQSGLTFYAFLDLNGNGIRDNGEPKVNGLNIRINGGNVIRRDKDSTIRVINLVPYTSYLVELNNNSFQNIAWKVKKIALNVYADPNQFKTIAIPVEVNSEATGVVSYTNKNGTRGLGRIYVNFYRSDKTLFGKILTESDGYYSFMGLKPGDYIARIDSSQLAGIRMTATPAFKAFTVKSSKDGDFIDGLDFMLQSTGKDTTEINLPKVDSTKIKIINYTSTGGKEGAVSGINKPEPRIENALPGVRYSQEFPTSDKSDGKNVLTKQGDLKGVNLKGKPNALLIRATDQYPQSAEAEEQRCSIQYGEYKSEKDALADQRTITTSTGKPVIIVLEDDVYKLWIEGFNNRREARLFLASLDKTAAPINAVREVVALNKVKKDASNPASKNNIVPDKGAKIIDILNPIGKTQLVDYTDSIAAIFKFEPKGSLTRGFPDKVKQSNISNMESKPNVKTISVMNKPTLSAVITLDQNKSTARVVRGPFNVQVDGFIFDKSATAALRRISTVTDLPIIVSIKNGFYSLMIEGFSSRKDAKLFEEKLTLMGFKGNIIKENF